jgi:hypothetical protein
MSRRKQAVTIWLDPEDIARLDALAGAADMARSTHCRDLMSRHLRALMPEAPKQPRWQPRQFFDPAFSHEEIHPEALGPVRDVPPPALPCKRWACPMVTEVTPRPPRAAPSVLPVSIEAVCRSARTVLIGRSVGATLMGDPPPGRSALDAQRSQRPAPADGGA